jgi:tRNA threonylcarbamoyladenosine biosynthesis protein TsaE
MIYHFFVSTPLDTLELAKKISSHIKIGDVITFEGDLGAGKTFFITQLIKALLGNDDIIISSPTFNLVHQYVFGDSHIWHFDLYRLKHFAEIYELGFEDTYNGVAFIEWPQIILPILPKDRLDIKIIASNDEKREITLYPKGLWHERLNGFVYEQGSEKK